MCAGAFCKHVGKINEVNVSRRAMASNLTEQKIYVKNKCAKNWKSWAERRCSKHSELKKCEDSYPKGESCTEIDPDALEKARKGSASAPAC
jgi:hypothetical protein